MIYPNEDRENFTHEQWNSFKEAVGLAFQGKDNPVGNIRNIMLFGSIYLNSRPSFVYL